MRKRSCGPLLLGLLLVPAAVPAQAPGGCPACALGAQAIERFGLRPMDRPSREWPGWAPPRRIVAGLGGEALAGVLRSAAPGADVVVVPIEEVADVIGDADVYIGWCTPEIIAAAPRLRWIQIPSAGAETCADVPAVAERGILVTNMQRVYGPQIAEHTLGLMLSLSRKLYMFRDHQRSGQWEGVGAVDDYVNRVGLIELDGRTLLISGLGGIGTEVARLAHAFGMRVVATRNSSRDGPDFVDYVGLSNELLVLAGRADIVVSAVPLTDETRGMYNAAFFRAMKPGAWFINVGRGESVVTDDLVDALRAGGIGGAALDVTDPEPLPPGHPLWTMENVIMTPHVAAASDALMLRASSIIAENLRRYVAGEPLVSKVDLARGY